MQCPGNNGLYLTLIVMIALMPVFYILSIAPIGGMCGMPEKLAPAWLITCAHPANVARRFTVEPLRRCEGNSLRAVTRMTGVHRTTVMKHTASRGIGFMGSPDAKHVSTSFVERQNLTMRMAMRRFTRLTNGFSKKIQNHEHAIALHYMHYNFARVHQTLRVTPAMEAGVADHVWSLDEIIALLGDK
jgi:hypothetical protein